MSEYETETEIDEITESAPTSAFNTGDRITLVRGKLHGSRGKILGKGVNGYAIELEDSTVVVSKETNLRAPADSTVSVSAIVQALHGLSQDPSLADAAGRLANALDAVAPGVSAKLNEASAS